MVSIRKGFLLILAVAILLLSAASGENVSGGKGNVQIYSETESGFAAVSETLGDALFVPTTIIGSDDREVVSDVTVSPYSAVAFLDVVCECGCGWECSGFLVGQPNIVITSAHSLVCSKHSKPAETLILYFGYESYRKNMYRYDGPWTALVGNHFSDHEYSFQEDWGIIRLEENVGDQVGYLIPNWNSTEKLDDGNPAVILGYSDGVLYQDEGDISIMDDTHFQYTLDQDAGTSGGPILSEDNHVVGIIIGHQEEDDGTQSNVGLRMTQKLHEAFDELAR